MRDRNQSYDVENTAPSTAPNVQKTNINGVLRVPLAAAPLTSDSFQPFQYSTCPAALMPLSFNWSALETKIDDLQPAGNTNVTIGLSWAHHALTAANPLNNAAPPDGLKKVIILLTDRDNTQNRWTNTQADIDARTQQACANVKANDNNIKKIELWTIRVIDGNASLLQACASKPGMYKNVQDASQLNTVFADIAHTLPPADREIAPFRPRPPARAAAPHKPQHDDAALTLEQACALGCDRHRLEAQRLPLHTSGRTRDWIKVKTRTRRGRSVSRTRIGIDRRNAR